MPQTGNSPDMERYYSNAFIHEADECDFQCMECGTFIDYETVANGDDQCPECGSTDLDLA